MKRTLGVILGLVLSASAQTSNLTGKWRATWLDGGTPNIFTLTDGTEITGHYTTDKGVDCRVLGFKSPDREVSLYVNCVDWDIQLDGYLTNDNLTINGKYLANGDHNGKFKMEKIPNK
jgi:hypothetical protein